MRGFLSRIPVGASLLLMGLGLFLVVCGVLMPSFALYWNRRFYWPRYVNTMQSLSSGEEYIVQLHVGPPITYNVTVDAERAVHVQLILLDEGTPSQDWGTGTHFSRTFMVMEGGSIRIGNPSLNDTVRFDITMLAEPCAAYPLGYLPKSLLYINPVG